MERARSIGQSAPVAVALLLLANALPLAGVLFFGWDVAMVLITYWLENGIVGLINIPKILVARDSRTTLANQPSGRVVYAAFFAAHYGIFWLLHGVFVFILFGRGSFSGFTGPFEMVANDPALLLAALALLASHGASFLVNYIGRGEYKHASPDGQAQQPYSRMVILHVTIVFGGVLIVSLGEPLAALVLLVVLKTAFDLFFHLREHGRTAASQGKIGPKGMETTRAG